MNRNTLSLLVLLIVLLTSCNQKMSEEPKNVAQKDNRELNDSLSAKTREVSIDSVFLDKVQSAYENKTLLSNNGDSIGMSGFSSEYYSLVPTKLNLNGDEFDDYVILYVDFHHVRGEFIDGHSGEIIKTSNSFYEGNLFFNRPYPGEDEKGLELKVVDMNDGDGQEELMILFSNGASPGSTTPPRVNLLLYRYNQDSTKVDNIFNELIMEYFLPISDSLSKVKANYIDILYDSKKRFDEINVYPGEPTITHCPSNFCDNWRDAKIQPKNQQLYSKYIFNEKLNQFEVKSRLPKAKP